MTIDSLLANASVFPPEAASRTGARHAAPEIAQRTTSASLDAATARMPSIPDCSEVADPFISFRSASQASASAIAARAGRHRAI